MCDTYATTSNSALKAGSIFSHIVSSQVAFTKVNGNGTAKKSQCAQTAALLSPTHMSTSTNVPTDGKVEGSLWSAKSSRLE